MAGAAQQQALERAAGSCAPHGLPATALLRIKSERAMQAMHAKAAGLPWSFWCFAAGHVSLLCSEPSATPPPAKPMMQLAASCTCPLKQRTSTTLCRSPGCVS